MLCYNFPIGTYDPIIIIRWNAENVIQCGYSHDYIMNLLHLQQFASIDARLVQGIAVANIDPDLCRHMASFYNNEFMIYITFDNQIGLESHKWYYADMLAWLNLWCPYYKDSGEVHISIHVNCCKCNKLIIYSWEYPHWISFSEFHLSIMIESVHTCREVLTKGFCYGHIYDTYTIN